MYGWTQVLLNALNQQTSQHLSSAVRVCVGHASAPWKAGSLGFCFEPLLLHVQSLKFNQLENFGISYIFHLHSLAHGHGLSDSQECVRGSQSHYGQLIPHLLKILFLIIILLSHLLSLLMPSQVALVLIIIDYFWQLLYGTVFTYSKMWIRSNKEHRIEIFQFSELLSRWNNDNSWVMKLLRILQTHSSPSQWWMCAWFSNCWGSEDVCFQGCCGTGNRDEIRAS